MFTPLVLAAMLVIMIPKALLGDYITHFSHLAPREAETSRAAHGIGFALLVPLAMHWADQFHWFAYLPDFTWPYLKYRWLAVYVIIAFGAYWFIIGAARSQGYRDGRYITRSLIKIGIGGAITYAQVYRLYPDIPFRRETYLLATLIGFWCIITGIVRLGLYMRGPPKPSNWRQSDALPSAGFGTGENLR
jgi:hypothetical protein